MPHFIITSYYSYIIINVEESASFERILGGTRDNSLSSLNGKGQLRALSRDVGFEFGKYDGNLKNFYSLSLSTVNCQYVYFLS